MKRVQALSLVGWMAWLAYPSLVLGQDTAAQPPAQEERPAATEQQIAAQEQPAPAGSGKLVVTPAEWDFGLKWYGEEAATEVTLKNEGSGPLTIKNVRSSCGCTVAKPAEGTWNGKVIPPGGTEVMKLSYNTRKAARKVAQTITIETDDPANPRFALKVSGEVKQAFDVKPQERIVFASVERDTVATETVELTNNMEQPIQLKVKNAEASRAFDVKLEEVEAGKTYRLSVTTRPPLNVGPNSATIILETGLPQNPEISIPVSAYIAPRVSVSPPKLFVSPKVAAPFSRVIRVTHRADNPIQIKEIKSSHPSITAEVQPPNPNANPNRTMQFIEIKVNLPAGADFPPEGAKLEIFTSDSDPEYQKLTVDIALRDLSAGRAQNVTPLQREPEGAQQAGKDKPADPDKP